MSKEILAAGTVCWRYAPDGHGGTHLLVLLIHRTKQKDVTFPKGKLDPGESMPEAAVRETLEETGLQVALGQNLGTIRYPLPGNGVKTVQYWAAEVSAATALASQFAPNNEIQALEWLPVAQVRKRLSYSADKELFDVFLDLVAHDLHDTFSVTLLRHAKAESRSPHYPVDHLRPLTTRGDRQAEWLAPMVAAFGPKRVYSSTAARCVQTAEPLAELLMKRVREKECLSQDAWDTGDTQAMRTFIGKLVKKRRSVVICSHRPMLPDLARELRLASGSIPGDYLDEAAALPPGGFSVFHFSRNYPGAGILGVETYPIKP